jgi:hypothetical protein
MQADEQRFTFDDIDTLTGGVVDANMVAEWHRRDEWLTPAKQPRRGKPYLYSLAHLFEVKFRAELISLGVSQKAAQSPLRRCSWAKRSAAAALKAEQRRET